VFVPLVSPKSAISLTPQTISTVRTCNTRSSSTIRTILEYSGTHSILVLYFTLNRGTDVVARRAFEIDLLILEASRLSILEMDKK
jgi:hypothetical protein